MNNHASVDAPKRRKVYVDERLQGRFMLGLVLLELCLFVAACGYLYCALAEIIENNLYVIHAAEHEALLPQMARELGLVALVCGALNSVALLVAHGLWSRHVSRVLGSLHRRMECVRSLDLRADSSVPAEAASHRLLELCERWIDAERLRIKSINGALARLPLDAPQTADAQDARAALQEAAGHLQRHVTDGPLQER